MQYKQLILISLIIIPLFSYSQTNKLILGSWIKTKMETVDKKITPLIEKRDKVFIKYTFKNDGQVYFTNTYNEIGYRNKYSLSNNIIDLSFNKLKIESIDSQNLVLIELEDNQITPNSTKIYLTKENIYLDQIPIKPNDFYVVNNDTIYYECPKVYPVFNNNTQPDLNMFLQVNVEGLSKGKEAFAYATFIINSDGKISEINLHHHINKSYDKNLLKAISKTESFWVSPVVNGKKVKVLKEIEFMYLEFPGVSQTGDDLILQHKNNIYSLDYRSNFKNAIKLVKNDDNKAALDFFSKCLNLTPDKSNILYQMSLCYEKLNDTENRNKYINETMKSNLNYLIKK